MMQLGEDKMSKSSGKLITIGEALDNYSSNALRLWVLSSHYRGPITYSDEIIASMERGAERLVRAIKVVQHESTATGINPQPYKEQFIEAMDDDFNTPQAVAILFDLARDINRGHDEKLDTSEAQELLGELASVLGLTLDIEAVSLEVPTEKLAEFAAKYGVDSDENTDAEHIIQSLLERRTSSRQAKNWQVADAIRNDLKELSVFIEDTPEGTVWRYRKP
jgi:cysteinyl-tRNA synthetase